MKHLPFGQEQLSAEECTRRLKIWFIQGSNPEVVKHWPDGKARHYHINETGGRRLNEFATGHDLNPLGAWSDEDINDMCRSIE